MTADPCLSIVIPVRNDATRLRRCLESLAANSRPCETELIVVDNGSEDDSAMVANRAGATVLTAPDLNVSALRNVGAARSRAPLIGFVDADHLLDPQWIVQVVRVFDDVDIAAAGAPPTVPVDANWVQRAYDRLRRHPTGQRDTEWLGSGNLIVRRKVFDAAGGFDSTLESCEDVDLCNRLRSAGFRLVVDASLRNVHLGDPASLRALLAGELWRGRDNLRVTLRGPLSVTAIPSILIPILDLSCLLAIVASIGTRRSLAIGAAAIVLGFATLRAVRMTFARKPRGLGLFLQHLVVAIVYDLARALALVFRTAHRTRRAPQEHRVRS